MDLALQAAKAAGDEGDVPVGAVLVSPTGQSLAVAGNRVERDHDPTAHAEILAIRQAALKLRTSRLVGCDPYVTLEPCAMCAQAIAFARIRRLYYGASDPKGGGVMYGARLFSQPTCHHRPEIYDGFQEQACTQLLRNFFTNLRET